MFEQSVIAGAPKGKRVWTTCLGVSSQILLVGAMVMAPMLWPQVLPPATFTLLVPTAPPGRAPQQKASGTTQHARTRPIREFRLDSLVQPTVPTTPPERIIDPAPDGNDAYVIGAPVGGGSGGAGAFLINGIIGGTGPIPKAPPVQPKPVEPAAAPVAKVEPIRVRAGGVVKEPRLIRRVDPIYPALARNARVSGVVKLTGVINVHGRIAELAVESGNVLLVRAALDAVAQWVYEPTLLNGDPVEVSTSIVVTFTLSQ